MEVLVEAFLATYLTRGGKVFIAPNYLIPAPHSKRKWSYADFVALDFEKREVLVVEMTITGADADAIIAKTKDRERQWFAPLRAKLKADGIAIDWRLRFLGFVRRKNLEKAQKALAGAEDVTLAAIEDCTFPWEYWAGEPTITSLQLANTPEPPPRSVETDETAVIPPPTPVSLPTSVPKQAGAPPVQRTLPPSQL